MTAYRPVLIPVFLLFSLLFFSYLWADTVYLNNGRTMEGLVEKEDDSRVTLNLGIGTITIPRDEISRIERAPDSEKKGLQAKWRRKYRTHSDFAPPRFKDIADKFNDLERMRNNAVKEKFQTMSRENKKNSCQKKITALYQQYRKINNTLSDSQPRTNQEINEHNALVSRSNALIAELKLLEQEKKRLAEESSSEKGSVSIYHSALDDLSVLLKGRVSGLEGLLSEEEKDFVYYVEAEMEKQSEQFDCSVIPLQPRGNVMFVSALINDRVPARFILDTGASMVLLSEGLARKLNVRKNEKDTFYTVIANGEKVKSYHVVLDSVSVSGMKAGQVHAAVLEKSLPSESDGLLGMSYLSNFIFRVDSKTNSLVLENFRP